MMQIYRNQDGARASSVNDAQHDRRGAVRQGQRQQQHPGHGKDFSLHSYSLHEQSVRQQKKIRATMLTMTATRNLTNKQLYSYALTDAPIAMAAS